MKKQGYETNSRATCRATESPSEDWKIQSAVLLGIFFSVRNQNHLGNMNYLVQNK